MTQNQIAYFAAKETQRHNIATEMETGRHNVKSEQNETYANQTQHDHFQRLDVENARHNLATEGEAARHNLASEIEIGRHNIAQESIDTGKLSETTRHNQATEVQQINELELAKKQLIETTRHNTQTENADWARIAETSRHNKMSEKIDISKVNLGIQELDEAYRHNIATELVQETNAQSTRLNTFSQMEVNDSIVQSNKANAEKAASEQALNAVKQQNTYLSNQILAKDLEFYNVGMVKSWIDGALGSGYSMLRSGYNYGYQSAK